MFKWSEMSVFAKAGAVAAAVVAGVIGIVLAQWSILAAGAAAAAVVAVVLVRALAPRSRAAEVVALSMVLALGAVATVGGSRPVSAEEGRCGGGGAHAKASRRASASGRRPGGALGSKGRRALGSPAGILKAEMVS